VITHLGTSGSDRRGAGLRAHSVTEANQATSFKLYIM